MEWLVCSLRCPTLGCQDGLSPTDCGASFRPEGAHEPMIFAKQVTDRPVVGVGRFISPFTMVSQIRKGILTSLAVLARAYPSFSSLKNKKWPERRDS